MGDERIYVAESVAAGHPDKLCDQVADAILDHCLACDPLARVEAECTVATGLVLVTLHHDLVEVPQAVEVARRTIAAVGYVDEQFDADNCTVLTSFNRIGHVSRSPRLESELDDEAIARLPARHQGTMFGYATDETPTGMPLPIVMAHRLARQFDAALAVGELPGLAPDAKTQIALEYVNRRAVRLHSLCLLVTGAPGAVTQDRLETLLRERVIDPALHGLAVHCDRRTRVVVNPGGPLHVGGPAVHSGLTGRKLAVDTYGDFARHGAAALSGKDPLRIERLGAYAARHAARNVVAAGLARECEVALSYAVGLAEPISIAVATHGTGRIPDAALATALRTTLDFRPAGIMRRFRLREAIAAAPAHVYFRPLAVYGQMGRDDLDPPWERLDAKSELRATVAA